MAAAAAGSCSLMLSPRSLTDGKIDRELPSVSSCVGDLRSAIMRLRQSIGRGVLAEVRFSSAFVRRSLADARQPSTKLSHHDACAEFRCTERRWPACGPCFTRSTRRRWRPAGAAGCGWGRTSLAGWRPSRSSKDSSSITSRAAGCRRCTRTTRQRTTQMRRWRTRTTTTPAAPCAAGSAGRTRQAGLRGSSCLAGARPSARRCWPCSTRWRCWWCTTRRACKASWRAAR